MCLIQSHQRAVIRINTVFNESQSGSGLFWWIRIRSRGSRSEFKVEWIFTRTSREKGVCSLPTGIIPKLWFKQNLLGGIQSIQKKNADSNPDPDPDPYRTVWDPDQWWKNCFFIILYRCPPDVIAANAELVQRDGVPVLDRHLDRLEVCVHGHVHACDCAVHLNN